MDQMSVRKRMFPYRSGGCCSNRMLAKNCTFTLNGGVVYACFESAVILTGNVLAGREDKA